MTGWVQIDEDVPLVSEGFVNVADNIDILLQDGTILQDCFYGRKQDAYFDKHGHRIGRKKLKAWRTSCVSR